MISTRQLSDGHNLRRLADPVALAILEQSGASHRQSMSWSETTETWEPGPVVDEDPLDLAIYDIDGEILLDPLDSSTLIEPIQVAVNDASGDFYGSVAAMIAAPARNRKSLMVTDTFGTGVPSTWHVILKTHSAASALIENNYSILETDDGLGYAVRVGS